MNSLLLVGGRFDREGGKPSKVFGLFARGFTSYFMETEPGFKLTYVNGGSLGTLYDLVGAYRESRTVGVWMPDVDNQEVKAVGQVKPPGSTMTLITSKALYDRKNPLSFLEVMQRALISRPNLILTIDRKGDRFKGTLLDPLGNAWDEGENFYEIGLAAAKQTLAIRSVTRVGSSKIAPILLSLTSQRVQQNFVSLVRRYADQFEQLILGPSAGLASIKGQRFLGNASFRCIRGFPSYRDLDGGIFVTRRNVAKDRLATHDFVAVRPYTPFSSKVEYYGAHKPSVDTPIHLLLYNALPQINFMIHGHVYLRFGDLRVPRTPRTSLVVPCGSLEEFEEIMNVLKKVCQLKSSVFGVNLAGHGFIAGATELKDLEELAFEARPTPEYQWDRKPL